MQWLIDLIAERVLQSLQGTIVIWSGSIVDIPDGWQLCDGTNGTPDLDDKFVRGAGDLRPVGATGGFITHRHTFTGDGHDHEIKEGSEIAMGAHFAKITRNGNAAGLTGFQDSRPPFYTLAFIMKL